MAVCSATDGYDHLIKLLLIGDSGVGKSSLLSRFTKGMFRPDENPTTTTNTVARHVYIDGKIVKAQIVDIAGNHRYRAFRTDILMQNAGGALIVFDVIRDFTFEDVEKWCRELHNANSKLEIMLIANKTDLLEASMTSITIKAGKAFAERASLSFVDTSAKDDRNVEKAFAELVNRIFRKIISNDRIDTTDEYAPPAFYSQARMSRSSGENEPAHYMLKIECFSLLSEAGTFVLESDIFKAGGYNWPQRTRIHGKNTKWGFSELISLDSFTDAGNGFLLHDSCVFGAEVFVASKYVEKDQCLSMIKPPVIMSTFSWTIDNFSAVTENVLRSGYFKIGKVEWELYLYPKGKNTGKDTHLSIFLQVHDPYGCRVYAKYEIRVKNKIAFSDKVIGRKQSFDADQSWGSARFILLSELHDMDKGFLSNDVLTVEAEFSVVGVLKDFY